jgi:hypothetical protein
VPRGVYPRKTGTSIDAPANIMPPAGKKKGRRWSKARRAALSEKMRKQVGRGRLSPTLEAAVLVAKMNDIVLGRIRDNFAPGALEILVLQAHAILSTAER